MLEHDSCVQSKVTLEICMYDRWEELLRIHCGDASAFVHVEEHDRGDTTLNHHRRNLAVFQTISAEWSNPSGGALERKYRSDRAQSLSSATRM